MTREEVLFAEGADAFKAGKGWTANPYPEPSYEHREWRFGWDTALSGKANAFRDYIKYRTLFDKRYASPGLREDGAAMQAAQAARWSRIAHYELTYPDFKPAYEAQQEERRR